MDGLSAWVLAIHTGKADERNGDYFGPALGRVARLLRVGHGGQVLLTRIAAEMVARESPPSGASLAESLGQYSLKDHDGHERVFNCLRRSCA